MNSSSACRIKRRKTVQRNSRQRRARTSGCLCSKIRAGLEDLVGWVQSDCVCGAKPRKDKDSRRDNDEPEDAAEVKHPGGAGGEECRLRAGGEPKACRSV